MDIILQVNHLKKYFKVPQGLLHAVDDVSFEIERGTTLGVVGESGCGKSTLGNVIIHLLDPTSGEIIFNGTDITHLKKKQFSELIKKMQIIFQDPFSSIDPRMNVSEIIAEPIHNLNIAKGPDVQKLVLSLMDTVGLASRFTRSYPHELDGGRRQRIGIARALAVNPDFIICDEPVSALDVSIQAQILNLLKELQRDQGLSYLFISHDLSVVKHISKRIAVMYLGEIVEFCDSKEMFKNPLHPYTKALISAIPVPNIHVKKHQIILTGELSSPINPKNGCRFAPRCAYAQKECFEKSPKMTEVSSSHSVACFYC